VRNGIVIPDDRIVPVFRRLPTNFPEPRQDTTKETPPKVVAATGTVTTTGRRVVDRRAGVAQTARRAFPRMLVHAVGTNRHTALSARMIANSNEEAAIADAFSIDAVS